MDIDTWVKWIGIASSIATVIIAWSALYVANKQLKLGWKQLEANIAETRNTTAHNLYHQYLSMCIDKPEFAYGMEKPEERTIDYGKYCWFISSMLFTFEQILETNSLDKKWQSTIKSQLFRHRNFLSKSSTVRERNWNDKLQKIINEVII